MHITYTIKARVLFSTASRCVSVGPSTPCMSVGLSVNLTVGLSNSEGGQADAYVLSITVVAS